MTLNYSILLVTNDANHCWTFLNSSLYLIQRKLYSYYLHLSAMLDRTLVSINSTYHHPLQANADSMHPHLCS
jgi:hypothetical protein